MLTAQKDHPRIRGEHHGFLSPRPHDAGSSPHTRGAQTLYEVYCYRERIIPAYAGSTTPDLVGYPKRPDHPRIRGEHALPYHRGACRVGSSPHTRGARDRVLFRRLGEWIIPAYAGSTANHVVGAEVEPDHPRIRGEHLVSGEPDGVGGGSSPHTRGALSARIGCRSTSPDHPRIRGEHRMQVFTSRGVQWIIPAYAGSTLTRLRPSDCRRDHPRIRGEHRILWAVTR